MRQLLILVLVIAAVWWVRRSIERFKSRRARAPRNDGVPQRMLACAHCGLHVPEAEGVHDEMDFFCCEAHRRLGVKR